MSFPFAAPVDLGPMFVARGETSRDAAEFIEPHKESQRGRVLAFIRSRGAFGTTEEECCDALGMNPSSYRPRCRELAGVGPRKTVLPILIQKHGERPTRSGCAATVWTAVTE